MLDWLKNLLASKPKSRIGIDIGSSSIKMVEIFSDNEGRKRLETYGLAFLGESLAKRESGTSVLEQKHREEDIEREEVKTTFRDFTEKSEPLKLAPSPNSILALLSDEEISQIIRELLAKAGAKTDLIYFSLPVFATFSTTFQMPALAQNELAAAIPFEAKKYIPIPLEDVVLDWNIVGETEKEEKAATEARSEENIKTSEENKGKTKNVEILLVAILKNIIDRYFRIASLSNLNVQALEPESISMARSLAGEGSIILVDVGSFFTNINLVENGVAKIIHNIKKPVAPNGEVDADKLLEEIKKVASQRFGQDISKKEKELKYIFAGGAAKEELIDFFRGKLEGKVVLGEPFIGIEYPGALKKKIDEIGLALGVAAGVAMRN